MSNVSESQQEVLELVDDLGAPERMTKGEWAEFLECLIADLQIRKEAVDQELKEEG